MSRLTTIALFAAAAVFGCLAFGNESTSRSAIFDAVFLVSVIAFLAVFVRGVGGQLRSSAQRRYIRERRNRSPAEAHGEQSHAHS